MWFPLFLPFKLCSFLHRLTYSRHTTVKSLALIAVTLSSTLIVPTAFAQQFPAQSQSAIIQMALDSGAHIYRCTNHKCRDEQTGEVIDHDGRDGSYLIFPDDMKSQQRASQTARALKHTSPNGD